MKSSLRRPMGAFVLLSAAFAVGCSEKVLDFRNAEVNNGKVFAAGENKPFSGKVTNVPEQMILGRQQGMNVFGQWARGFLVAAQLTSSICDAKSKDGLLDGEVICRRPASESMKYKLSFDGGRLEGKLTVYDMSPENKVLARATFAGGALEGESEVIATRSGKIVAKAGWSKGQMHGRAESYSDVTGQLISRADYTQGQVNGEMVVYAEDGKQLLYRATANMGAKEGVEEEFYPNGQIKNRVHWRNGKQHGTSQSWSPNGQLSFTNVYEDGVFKPAQSTSLEAANAPGGCVDKWAEAHRREVGAEAMIRGAQLEEWKEWCLAGKLPPR